jgi:hypothetical protein
MKEKKHYPIKNSLGGESCWKCLNWSSVVGGLRFYKCLATKKEIKENRFLLETKLIEKKK